jgi:ParB family chromosome partitioning protein
MDNRDAEIRHIASKVILKDISIVYLKRGVYQPRKNFPEDSLESLAETIKRDGILEPLLVRPFNNQYYEIIAGERCWRAAQRARLQVVPCLIKNYSDEEAARISLIENTNRENLDPISEALAICRIIEEFGYTHEETAAVLGRPRSVITNMLRLLKLDTRIQEHLRNGDLSEAHCKILAGLPIEKQYMFALEVLNKSWTTRSLEIAIRKNNRGNKATVNKDINIAKIEQHLSDKLGHPVTFRFKRDKSGSITISFQNYISLDAVLEKLGYDSNSY